MKTAAFIFLCLFTFITIQPLFAFIPNQTKDCCTEKPCKKEGNKGNDENKNCNPLMACPLCTLFLVSAFNLSENYSIKFSEKTFVENDNRIIKKLSGYWHPPNF